MDKIKFKNQVAIVTGAGGGLGKTYALELADRGCKVVVNDPGVARDGSGGGNSMADHVVAEIREKKGEALANYDPIDSPEGAAALVQSALEKYRKVDILIHNAGILRDRSFVKMTQEEWKTVLGVHLNGGFHVAMPLWKIMRENNYGRIVFTTSVSGLFGNFGQANYGAAKMGLVGLMNVLAIEGAKYNIKVNCISPTALTRMTEDLDRSGSPEISRDPAHVTPAAIYLASENCQDTSTIIHAGHGFYGRVQVAHNKGVFLGKKPVTVEELASRWEEITNIETLELKSTSPFYLAHIYELAGV